MQYPVSVIDDTPNSATSDEMTDIDAFNDGLQAALTGTKPPEQAMKDSQREAERILRPSRK